MPETKDHTKEQGNALQEIIAQRYAEVKEIRSLGVEPYPTRCEKKQSCLEAKNSPEGTEVVTAGRIMQLRSMGKAASLVACTISGLYCTNALFTYSVCTFTVFAFGVRRLPINRDVPLSKRMEISLVPRHFPVQGDVQITPVLHPKVSAIRSIFFCRESSSYL